MGTATKTGIFLTQTILLNIVRVLSNYSIATKAAKPSLCQGYDWSMAYVVRIDVVNNLVKF